VKTTKNFVINLILVITAITLAFILFPAGLSVGLVKSFLNRKWYKGIFYLSQNFRAIAVSIDQLGNVVCSHLFNITLIKKDSKHLFGNPDETISSVLGKNKLNGTLTKIGIILTKILHFFDKNHSIKSIEQI
jgi:hypothetical protein